MERGLNIADTQCVWYWLTWQGFLREVKLRAKHLYTTVSRAVIPHRVRRTVLHESENLPLATIRLDSLVLMTVQRKMKDQY